ncbi:MAG: hypothetical protein A3C36_01710 [Omnitrophica WOR_2 bacterium RIFCSPHIGHO2_02_FULL_52_10]|nr:MAG: hypothetical protein A3C36_01710 [Omnitrophica WOR_2 bacterium RIFCSPHIGHO2_02_FULL_52_10]
MSCEKFQEMILTDYLDRELSAQRRASLEAHLTQCPGCREFAEQARKGAVEPFEQLERLKPSPQLWANIKEAIEEDPQPAVRGALVDFWERLKLLFYFPRPALALATVVLMIVMLLAVLPKPIGRNHIAQVESVAEEEVEYLASLMEGTESMDSDGNGGYGTAIEEYFL